MTTIVWDAFGERRFQTGVNRGVLYKTGEAGVPWNGLTSVEENFDREVKPYYMDGIKYLETQVVGDYTAKLKAFTYPDFLDELTGTRPVATTGMYVHEQSSSRFGLSYRTLIGNDVYGDSFGYKIHMVYNVLATPDPITAQSIDSDPAAFEFGWTLQASPVLPAGIIPYARPTAHMSVDSTKISPDILNQLELILYGSDENDPRMPTLIELLEIS